MSRTFHPRFKLWLNSGQAQGAFGDGKWRLLKAIRAQGSLSAASRSLGISYRKAWGDIHKAERSLGFKLIETERGGKAGGNTQLTEKGQQLIDAYKTYRTQVEDRIETSFCECFTGLLRPSKQGGKSGFTLIEMLVVIAIIASLAAILMPSLRRAKGLAQITVCQARLRQWGLGFEAYAAENDGYYPHVDGRDRLGGAQPRRQLETYDYLYGWVDVIPPLFGEKPWREYERHEHPGPDTIYQCPTATLVDESLYDYRPRRNGYFSYAMNSCLELDGNCWPPHDDPEGNDMPSFLQISRVRNADRLVLLFDQLLDPQKGYDGKQLNRSAGRHCGSYPKAFSARHRKKKNELGGSILFCDYHVEFKTSVWKDEWPDDLEVPARDDVNWFPQ